MIVGIIGTRRRDTLKDFELVEAAFRHIYEPGSRIVSGGCPRGGDRFAELIAIQLAHPGYYIAETLMKLSLFERHSIIKKSGAPIHIHPAEWHKHGKSAGFKRNHFIARDADWLIACVAPDRTGGTENTISLFLKKENHGELILV